MAEILKFPDKPKDDEMSFFDVAVQAIQPHSVSVDKIVMAELKELLDVVEKGYYMKSDEAIEIQEKEVTQDVVQNIVSETRIAVAKNIVTAFMQYKNILQVVEK